MDLKELKENSRKMLATFINSIDLNGEWYSQINTTPLAWGNPRLNACGEFISPGSKRLDRFLQTKRYDDITRRNLIKKGLILINQSYRQQEADPELYVTLIHETLHANRDLLLFDTFREGGNESSYSYNNGRFEQNTAELSSKHADASQEILKGNIDTSRKTIDSYVSKTFEEIEDMEFAEHKINDQMEKQRKIDESLVEIMARLSYTLYRDKQEGKESDIWDMIQGIMENSKEEYYELIAEDSSLGYLSEDTILAKDRAVMCDILLKHHDFELFNWMVDPISYSLGDIHYDFFGQYTKDDKKLLEKLYEDEGKIDLDDEYSLDSPDIGKITSSDIKKVATSTTAIKELSSSFEDIKQAQTKLGKDKGRI